MIANQCPSAPAQQHQLMLFDTPALRSDQGRLAESAPLPEWSRSIEDFLGESDGLYPGIVHWWRKSVLPDLGEGRRLCRAISVDGAVAALAIARIERKSSKLCTLRVDPKFRNQGLGQRLLRQVLGGLLESGTRRVHFTISEQILDECGSFFQPYGFRLAHWRQGWYVRGMWELAFSARASVIRDALSGQGQLWPEHGRQVTILSVRPRHAAAIESGLKRVEFRRRFSRRAGNSPALVYATSPLKQFRLSAMIGQVEEDTPQNLWDRFGPDGGSSLRDFQEYFSGAHSGFALPLLDVTPLPRPIGAESPTLRSVGFRPPQSFAILDRDAPLIRAVVASV